MPPRARPARPAHPRPTPDRETDADCVRASSGRHTAVAAAPPLGPPTARHKRNPPALPDPAEDGTGAPWPVVAAPTAPASAPPRTDRRCPNWLPGPAHHASADKGLSPAPCLPIPPDTRESPPHSRSPLRACAVAPPVQSPGPSVPPTPPPRAVPHPAAAPPAPPHAHTC